MLRIAKNAWLQIYRKNYWPYILLSALISLTYGSVRASMIDQEATVVTTYSTLTTNMIALFMLFSWFSPTIARKLHKPRWAGYLLNIPIWVFLIHAYKAFKLVPRFPGNYMVYVDLIALACLAVILLWPKPKKA